MHLLGLAIAQSGQAEEGAKLIQQAIHLQPRVALYHANMGYALSRMGHPKVAILAYRQAVSLDPRRINSWLDLAHLLLAAGDQPGAIEALKRVLELEPDSTRALNDLGVIYLADLKIDEALACFERSVAIAPESAEGHHHLGSALSDCGEIEAGVDEMKRAVELAPSTPAPASALIYMLQFDPRADRAAIYREMCDYERRIGKSRLAPGGPKPRRSIAGRRLRIGYVSPDFYTQAECYFVLPLLRAHDREKFEIHCYSSVSKPDEITREFKACAGGWHEVLQESDEALAERIRRDEIDILIDLTMHMRGFRLPVFAQKPAPVQATWLAYPGGTGSAAMDYRLTDEFLDPPGVDGFYSEKSIRLPGCWCCYDPLEEEIPASGSARDFARFASLNNPIKHNDATLVLWRKVLKEVPDSRLMLLMISERQRQRTRQLFAEAGIAPERLEFAGRQGRWNYLSTYNDIDVCLDPLPYNGITTTLDALWMGTPVVSLVGNTAPGRAGLSILSAAGFAELVATSEEEFIDIACRRKMPARQEIRRRFRLSPLMDARTFARNMEAAYRKMWEG